MTSSDQDSEKMVGELLPGLSVLCAHCRHRIEDGEGPICCKAFPRGIPEEIIQGMVIHTAHYPGDGGITYQPMIQFSED